MMRALFQGLETRTAAGESRGRAWFAVLLGGAMTMVGTAARADAPDFRRLTPAVRQKIDGRALSCPDGSPLANDGPFFGELAGWMVSRTPLRVEEEVRRADHAAAELEQQFPTAGPPAAAVGVLDKLVAELPERFRKPPMEFSLRVIDVSQWLAFTPGGGRLFISRAYLEALLADRQRGPSRLAFVLAHEIGHIARQHTRRGYQLAALEDAAQQEALSEVERARLRRLVAAGVRRTGDWLVFLYSREEDFEADLLAIHLCRNAGFDLEDSLDVVRMLALRDDPREGPESLLGGILEHDRTAPGPDRLKRLRLELDGVIVGDAYGLMRFDPEQHQFVPAKAHRAPAGGRGVVFIHGQNSDLSKFGSMAELLHERDGELLLYGFQYPGDASLARVSRALLRAMSEFGDDAERLDFICHSAGGLAFRCYAEIERGRFRQAVFLGTPHAGSDLAALREFLEVQQFAGDVRLGIREAIENAESDGEGQIGFDLLPDSLFLRHLNRGRPAVERYAIFRGRRYQGRRLLALRASTDALRLALRGVAPETVRLGPFEEETDRWIERIKIPDEILDGDLAVSVESAGLEGVTRVETVRASHHRLQQHPDVMAGVADIVLSPDVPEE